jgi:hypothetical protein
MSPGNVLFADLEHLILGMPDAVPCPEYISLRWEYEAALQRWGDLLLAQHAEPADAHFKRAVELRRDAADERDAANKRMEDHKQSCPVCLNLNNRSR